MSAVRWSREVNAIIRCAGIPKVSTFSITIPFECGHKLLFEPVMYVDGNVIINGMTLGPEPPSFIPVKEQPIQNLYGYLNDLK